jgi:hypothetical protein
MKLAGNGTASPARRRWSPWRLLCLVCIGVFLAGIARFYDRTTGFTSLVSIGDKMGDDKMSALKAVPHHVYEDSFGYDGAYYVQIALDPLLTGPELNKSVDNLPYRAKRILLSWTAWLLGAGQPFWIVHVYPLLNVLSWLALACLLWRWFPPDGGDNFLRWAGVLFSHGVCMSVRHSLVDGPSLLLVAGAAALIEAGRRNAGTALLAVATLGKETSVLALPALLRLPANGWRPWLNLAARAALVIAPLAAWVLYINLRLPPAADGVGLNNFTLPLMGFFEKWIGLIGEFGRDGVMRPLTVTLLALVALTVQAAFVLSRWQPAAIWWRIGAPFALLLAMVAQPVWEGYPGAATRVVLPLTLAFNVLVPRGRRWLPVLLAGNISIFAGIAELAPPLRDFYRLAGEQRQVAAVIVERGDGWYQAESDGNNSWRWSRQKAGLHLTNRSKRPLEIRISAELGALSNRHMELRVNSRAIFDAPILRRGQHHVFPAFVLEPGTTLVEFVTDQPASKPASGDPRELSLSVGNVVIAVAPADGTKP